MNTGCGPGSGGIDGVSLLVPEIFPGTTNSIVANRFVAGWMPIAPTNCFKMGDDSEPNVDVVSISDGGIMPPTAVGSMCCPIVPRQVTFGGDDTIV